MEIKTSLLILVVDESERRIEKKRIVSNMASCNGSEWVNITLNKCEIEKNHYFETSYENPYGKYGYSFIDLKFQKAHNLQISAKD